MAEARQVRVFVSSPGDAVFERGRLERVIERLNGAFQGVVRLSAIRWETEFYKAHKTFQAQIPEAAQCDIVVAIFRSRLGTELPADFPHMDDGEPYPSGTAYEVLTAIGAAKASGLPDVYVFRFPQPPSVRLDAPDRAEIEAQWERLKFFFDTWFRTQAGQFKAAFHTFASTDDFEAQVEALLRKWLDEKILQGRSVVWPVEIKGSPFRGLDVFGAKHAPVFFGRSRDIAKAVDRLKDAAERGCPLLLIDGASGAGKSSLTRAGLVPRLTAAGVVPSVDAWRVASMRPGELSGDPFAALANALFARSEQLPEYERGRASALPELSSGAFARPEDLSAQLAHADDTALKPLISTLDAVARALRDSGGYERDVKTALLLVIDQLDELFGLAEETRTRFARLLDVLVRSQRVWVITTLRADLLDRFLALPVLKQLKEDGASYDVAPPDSAELVEIVCGPAVAAGLHYDKDPATGETLDELLLKDAERPDLLPLLQFALNQLFEAAKQSAEPDLLSFAAYRALGGLAGAVDKEAEAALQALGDAERARLPRLLRQLAAPSRDGGEAVSTGLNRFDIRPVALKDAAYDDGSAKLVGALIDARILRSSGTESQAAIRLAHARVLDAWKRAKAIVAENVDFYRIRADLEAQRRRWEGAAGRERHQLLLRDPDLANGIYLRKRWGDELSAALRAFIGESAAAARASARRRWVVAGLVMLALGAFAAFSAIGFYEANNATRTAVRATAKFDIIRAAVESPKSGRGASKITEDLLTQLDNLVSLEIAPKSILWYDANPANNVSETQAFQKMGFRIVAVSSLADALSNSKNQFDLIITRFGNQQGGTQASDAYVLKRALDASGAGKSPVIIYSTGVTDAFACGAQKDGFYDEVDKPAELFAVVLRAAQGIATRSRCPQNG
jgi:hypothetical protein